MLGSRQHHLKQNQHTISRRNKIQPSQSGHSLTRIIRSAVDLCNLTDFHINHGFIPTFDNYGNFEKYENDDW